MLALDRLTQVALAGTARAAGRAIETGTPVDELLTGLREGAPERRLLLAAGALAIYRQAGRSPRPDVAAPEPAREERLPACSPGAARLIGELLAGQHADLLPEALALLGRAGRRLSPEFLPGLFAAGARRSELRPAIVAVMGERGRWLARHNPEWRWAADVLPQADTLPPDAETIWQEGTSAQRLAVLRLVRGQDPARAREWLAGVWKQEKADFRAEAIRVLEVGLWSEDEPFLEAALDDRSVGVREGAAKLLARLPDSAFATRMRERADAMLDHVPNVAPGGRFRVLVKVVTGATTNAGRLVVSPPSAFDKAWQRDGVIPKPPDQLGERAWWLTQILSRIPPSHWEARFGVGPADLAVAASSDEEWGGAVMTGLTQATLLHDAIGWAPALWDRWGWVPRDGYHEHHVFSFKNSLIGIMRQLDAEQRIGEALSTLANGGWRHELLAALPTPWSVEFGRTVLRALRDHHNSAFPTTGTLRNFFQIAGSVQPSDIYAWMPLLTVAGPALPPACFAEALEDWPVPERQDWTLQQWRRELAKFTETIRIRQRLMEEIER